MSDYFFFLSKYDESLLINEINSGPKYLQYHFLATMVKKGILFTFFLPFF